ncbi:ABC transporter substrate-binding protein [Dictyobacter kobayashii]|uniref:ABC transporter substrate-binding protein n=1 Tax=Dictyobacter kobayashii TaxID=2014872 RepID=A0A402ARW5_9CHLR|nr:ABC transporter substrate-binding protein [Dictyobacter kobayashii]GCE21839.1 ABC transporter substrate-binding protein [Dictyobacter kobayashii]
MRRTWTYPAFVCLILMVLALSACGTTTTTNNQGNSSTTSNSDPTQFNASKQYSINFWEAFATGANKTALAALTKQYTDQHPNVKINLQAYDSYTTLQTKLNAAIAAKNPPAIAQVYENWAVQYKQNDNIVSLQPYISGKNGLSSMEMSDFYPALLKDGQIDGQQYMMPFNKSDEVLYYNADVLKKMNITPPTNLNELIQDLGKVTKSDGSQWGLSLTPSVDEWSILYKALGGKDFVSSDGQKVAFTQDSNKTYAKGALDALAPLVKSGVVHVTKQYAWQNDFASQKSVFAISTVASYSFLAASIKGAFAFNEAAIPAGPGGQYTVLYGTNLSLFKGVSDDTRAVAWDYLKFLISKDSNTTFVQKTGYLPIRQSVYNSETMNAYYAKFPARKVGSQQINNAFVASFLPGWQKCRDEISNDFTSVLNGQSSSDAALSKMEQQCNDGLTQ